MLKKILSILLVSLLVMSSMGSVFANTDHYKYTCKLGQNMTTHDIMMSIGDPFWVRNCDLHDTILKSGLFAQTGFDTKHGWSYNYTAINGGYHFDRIENVYPIDDDVIWFYVMGNA
jgi:hypothetical protein